MPIIHTKTENAARYGNRLVSHVEAVKAGEIPIGRYLTYSEMMRDTEASGIPIGVGTDLERLLEALEDAGLPLGLSLFVVPKIGTLGDHLHVEGFSKRGIRKETLIGFRRETLDFDWSGVEFSKKPTS